VSEMPPEGGVPIRILLPEDALWPQGGYANFILVNHTPHDFTIRLAQLVMPAFAPGQPPPPEALSEDGALEIRPIPVAHVTMPPPAFRDLALVVQDQVAKYNEQFGAIGGTPPNFS